MPLSEAMQNALTEVRRIKSHNALRRHYRRLGKLLRSEELVAIQKVIDEIDLPEDVFAVQVNQHLVWEVVNAYLASRRRGTHKTKERSDVKGTRTKPWKQKHTGRARAGSRQSPLWRSGGTVHGPKPRSYTQKVNKKARRAALRRR